MEPDRSDADEQDPPRETQPEDAEDVEEARRDAEQVEDHPDAEQRPGERS